MLRPTRDLIERPYLAPDGEMGHVLDLYFDDRSWRLRHLVLETDPWLPGVALLLPPESIEAVDDEKHAVRLLVRRADVQRAPTMLEDEPVSRRDEHRFPHRMGWRPFVLSTPSSVHASLHVAPLRSHTLSNEKPGAGNQDPALRSVNAVRGFAVHDAKGETLGVVEDLTFDDADWSLRHAVVRTDRSGPEESTRVGVDRIRSVDWEERRIESDRPAEEIQEGPA